MSLSRTHGLRCLVLTTAVLTTAVLTTAVLTTAVLTTACGRINYTPLRATEDAAIADEILDILCSPPQPVTTTTPSNNRFEPALQTDGLSLYARGGGLVYEARRGDLTAAFSDWTATTKIDSLPQDQSFIIYDGDELAATARGSGVARVIELCRPPFDAATCLAPSFFSEGGAQIVGEADGPTLAIRDGKLLMAFNQGVEIYFASPRGQELLEWDAQLIDLGLGGGDDPSLTDEGGILLLPLVEGIYFSSWDAATGAYLGAKLLDGVGGGSPEIGIESAGGFELFVSIDSRGVNEPHRSRCTYVFAQP